MKNTTNQVSTRVHKNKLNPPNPEGKGGFGDNPEHRSPGGWKREDSITYQYNFLLRLSVSQFRDWLNEHPEEERTMAQEIAYKAVFSSRKDIQYLKEITDRTEGKAPLNPKDQENEGVKVGIPQNEREVELLALLIKKTKAYERTKRQLDEG